MMPLQIVISKAELLRLLNGAALVYEVAGIAVDISLAQPNPPDPPQAREFLPTRRRGERK
jgi:hypothetical protein